MGKLRVTLVQQPLVWAEPAANRERFAALLTPLAGSTDLVVLPETFTTGFSMEVERLGEPAAGTAGATTTGCCGPSPAPRRCATTTSGICFAWVGSISTSPPAPPPGACRGAASP